MLRDFSSIQASVERVTAKGAMNSLLWLAGIVCPLSLVMLYFAPADTRWVYQFLVIIIVISVIAAFAWLLFKDPNRLQSEDYQIEFARLSNGLGDDMTGERPASVVLEQVQVPNENVKLEGEQYE
tara:strand:+ start:182 stop:556 length:375 start_codon:yes stop_codon:yes gene_type:complete